MAAKKLDKRPEMSIYIDPHPGGDEYGYVISSLVHEFDSPDSSDGPISGSADTAEQALAEMKRQASAYAKSEDYAAVEILVDGNWEFTAQPPKRGKKR
jgi:hypothetical protein